MQSMRSGRHVAMVYPLRVLAQNDMDIIQQLHFRQDEEFLNLCDISTEAEKSFQWIVLLVCAIVRSLQFNVAVKTSNCYCTEV